MENNSKIDSSLLLAMSIPVKERMQSENLAMGYEEQYETWQVIVRYQEREALERAALQIGFTLEFLLSCFAILEVLEVQLETVAALPCILYMEQPKALYFQDIAGYDSSCLPVYASMESGLAELTGKDVLIGILDSGIDFYQADFRNKDGSTRVVYFYDQDSDQVYLREDINKLLFQEGASQENFDRTGHGTAVAAIAAGNSVTYGGVAPDTELVVVKLRRSKDQAGFYFARTTEILRGITKVLSYALDVNKPIAVNISLGNNYGAHNGSALLEQYLDLVSYIGRNVICVGAGNEATARGHCELRWDMEDIEEKTVELLIGSYENSLSLQMWILFTNQYHILIEAPGGTTYEIDTEIAGSSRYSLAEYDLLIETGEPSPYSMNQEIYVAWIKKGSYLPSGVWGIKVHKKHHRVGYVSMYLPALEGRSIGTQFTEQDVQRTITIPATASSVIAVGAYDPYSGTLGDFSGRGYIDNLETVKPELVAPGVQILSLVAGESNATYRPFTGTSFAVPFVTGAAALLMEWGIVQKNDIYLYGQKLKAYLLKGAQVIHEELEYPNDKWGADDIIVSS